MSNEYDLRSQCVSINCFIVQHLHRFRPRLKAPKNYTLSCLQKVLHLRTGVYSSSHTIVRL